MLTLHHQAYLIEKLECVQRNVTRWIIGKDTPYEDRLKSLKLATLVQRREFLSWGGEGEGNSRVKCTLNSISPVTKLKGITSNLTLTCHALKFARHVFILGFFTPHVKTLYHLLALPYSYSLVLN